MATKKASQLSSEGNTYSFWLRFHGIEPAFVEGSYSRQNIAKTPADIPLIIHDDKLWRTDKYKDVVSYVKQRNAPTIVLVYSPEVIPKIPDVDNLYIFDKKTGKVGERKIFEEIAKILFS